MRQATLTAALESKLGQFSSTELRGVRSVAGGAISHGPSRIYCGVRGDITEGQGDLDARLSLSTTSLLHRGLSSQGRVLSMLARVVAQSSLIAKMRQQPHVVSEDMAASQAQFQPQL